jgi:hypothetical protein
MRCPSCTGEIYVGVEWSVTIIASHLQIASIVYTGNHWQISRRFALIIRDDAKLQYMIALGKEGLLANPWHHDTASFHERMQRLEDRRRRWQTLDWMDHYTLPLGPGRSSDSSKIIAWDFVGGVFATLHQSVGEDQRKCRLRAVYLPSSDIPGSKIIWKDVGLFVEGLRIDPSQDLVAYTEHIDESVPGFAVFMVTDRSDKRT